MMKNNLEQMKMMLNSKESNVYLNSCEIKFKKNSDINKSENLDENNNKKIDNLNSLDLKVKNILSISSFEESQNNLELNEHEINNKVNSYNLNNKQQMNNYKEDIFKDNIIKINGLQLDNKIQQSNLKILELNIKSKIPKEIQEKGFFENKIFEQMDILIYDEKNNNYKYENKNSDASTINIDVAYCKYADEIPDNMKILNHEEINICKNEIIIPSESFNNLPKNYISYNLDKNQILDLENKMVKNLCVYELTDETPATSDYEETNDEYSEFDSPFLNKKKKKKLHPQWVSDKDYIRDKILEQNNNNKILEEIFGPRQRIEYLDINNIFSTSCSQFDIRGESADWKIDNTISSRRYNRHSRIDKIDEDIKIENNDEHSVFSNFKKTSRNLFNDFNYNNYAAQ